MLLNSSEITLALRQDRISRMLVVWAFRTLSLSIFLTVVLLSAQLPPPQKLSAEDEKGFTEELNHVRNLLASANDKCSVEFQMARTYAAGGQYREAMDWLKRVVNTNSGFDPSRDRLFDKLAHTREFQALVEDIRALTPPISNSRLVTTIPQTDLFPENLAYDPATKAFFLGSTLKDEIVRCPQQGACSPFVAPHREGLGYVLGLKIHQQSQTLWATSNTENGASLRHYSLTSGKLIRSYPLLGAHLFNDLAVSSKGEVFVTDTKEGAVYKLSDENSQLERFVPSHAFTAANGIALSPNETTLYVANFGDGVTVINLSLQSAKPLPHPAGVCLGYIDGLYATKGSLIAIQNGPMVPRIACLVLSSDGSRISAMEVLERRNSFFDGITTGVLLGNQLYYIANTQIDKVENGKIKAGAPLDPLRILAIDIQPR